MLSLSQYCKHSFARLVTALCAQAQGRMDEAVSVCRAIVMKHPHSDVHHGREWSMIEGSLDWKQAMDSRRPRFLNDYLTVREKIVPLVRRRRRRRRGQVNLTHLKPLFHSKSHPLWTCSKWNTVTMTTESKSACITYGTTNVEGKMFRMTNKTKGNTNKGTNLIEILQYQRSL